MRATVMVILLVLAVGSSLPAQPGDDRGRLADAGALARSRAEKWRKMCADKQNYQPFEISGTLKMGRTLQPNGVDKWGVIEIATDKRSSTTVWVAPDAIVEVTGTARADILPFVRPGWNVKFVGNMPPGAGYPLKVEGVIDALAVVTRFRGPRVEKAGLVCSDVIFNAPGVIRLADGKPVHPVIAKGPLLFTGEVVKCQGKQLTVVCELDNVTCELADVLQIDVDINDYTIARPGDVVSAKGHMVPVVGAVRIGVGAPALRAEVGYLTIRMAKPLTASESKRRGAKAPQSSKK